MSETGWSLTETRALAVKAARGAGFSWGLAEEAGFAVEWLEARGACGAAALASYLDSGIDANSCPVQFGAALCDGAVNLDQLNYQIHQPLLLVPFVVTAIPDATHQFIWNDKKCTATPDGVEAAVDGLEAIASVKITQCDQIVSNTHCSRVPASRSQAIKRLMVHAHKTYAPATDASRLAGAGAGLSDND